MSSGVASFFMWYRNQSEYGARTHLHLLKSNTIIRLDARFNSGIDIVYSSIMASHSEECVNS